MAKSNDTLLTSPFCCGLGLGFLHWKVGKQTKRRTEIRFCIIITFSVKMWWVNEKRELCRRAHAIAPPNRLGKFERDLFEQLHVSDQTSGTATYTCEKKRSVFSFFLLLLSRSVLGMTIDEHCISTELTTHTGSSTKEYRSHSVPVGIKYIFITGKNEEKNSAWQTPRPIRFFGNSQVDGSWVSRKNDGQIWNVKLGTRWYLAVKIILSVRWPYWKAGEVP